MAALVAGQPAVGQVEMPEAAVAGAGAEAPDDSVAGDHLLADGAAGPEGGVGGDGAEEPGHQGDPAEVAGGEEGQDRQPHLIGEGRDRWWGQVHGGDTRGGTGLGVSRHYVHGTEQMMFSLFTIA